jgi:hypothetical protein
MTNMRANVGTITHAKARRRKGRNNPRPDFASLRAFAPSRLRVSQEKVTQRLDQDAAMTRRFQFSLRALLFSIALASIGLGAWRSYTAHFASYVMPVTARVGQPIIVRGQFYLKDGADSTDFEIGVAPWLGSHTSMRLAAFSKCRAERTGIGVYRFSEPATCPNQSLWTEPGEFGLYLMLPDGRYIAGRAQVKP